MRYIRKALEKGCLEHPGSHAVRATRLRVSSVLDSMCAACCLSLSTGSYYVCIQIHATCCSVPRHTTKTFGAQKGSLWGCRVGACDSGSCQANQEASYRRFTATCMRTRGAPDFFHPCTTPGVRHSDRAEHVVVDYSKAMSLLKLPVAGLTIQHVVRNKQRFVRKLRILTRNNFWDVSRWLAGAYASSSDHLDRHKNPVLIRDHKVKWLDFGTTPDEGNLSPHPGFAWMKAGYSESIEWRKVRLTKQRNVDLTTDGLWAMPLNSGWVPVKSRRLQDWQKLKKYVPNNKHGDVCPNGVPALPEKDNANDDSE